MRPQLILSELNLGAQVYYSNRPKRKKNQGILIMKYHLKYPHLTKKLVSYEQMRLTDAVSTPGDCPIISPNSCSPLTLSVLKKSPVHQIPRHQDRLQHLIDVTETSLMTIYLAKKNNPDYIYSCFHRLCACIGVSDTDIQVQAERLLGIRSPGSAPMLWPPMISKIDIDHYRKNPVPKYVLQTLVELGYTMSLYDKETMPYLRNLTDALPSPSQRHINPKGPMGCVLRFIHHPTPYSDGASHSDSLFESHRLMRDLRRFFRENRSLQDAIRLIQATQPSALSDFFGSPLSEAALEDIDKIWLQLNLKTLFDAVLQEVRLFRLRNADKHGHFSEASLRLIEPEIARRLRQLFQVGIQDGVITLDMISSAIDQAFSDDLEIQNGKLKAFQASFNFISRYVKPALTRRNLLPEFSCSKFL